MIDYSNDLIYGKNKITEVLTIEVVNDQILVYKLDGTVLTIPMVYWLLSPKPYHHTYKKLKGNQHYCYGKKFSSETEYKKELFKLRKYKKDFYTIWNKKEAALVYYGITLFKDLTVDKVPVLSFDIESSGLVKNSTSQVFIISNTFRDKNGNIDKRLFRLDNYNNDIEMIDDWCKWIVEKDPTVLVGHNIYGFDIPYLQYCYAERQGNTQTLPLGKYAEPMEINSKPSEFRVDGNTTWSYNKLNISGRHIIDTMFLAVKHDVGRDYRSWGLKSIIEDEGLIKKDRQFYDAAKIKDNWSNLEEREKICKYAEDDGDDALALYDLMIPPIFYMTQSVPKCFQTMGISASGAQLNSILVRAYLQDGYSIPKASDVSYLAGGMSYGIPGMYKNVIKLDAASYYPSTIIKFKVNDDDKDPKQYFLKMVEYFTTKRFEQKRMYKETHSKYYDDLQKSSKVFINSSYGILATKGLNYNSPENAKLITKCCRAGLQKAIIWATSRGVDEWWSEYKESSTASQDFLDSLFIDDKCEVKSNNMISRNYILVNIDTDSLSFCKHNQNPFSKEEIKDIHTELNKVMYCEWEDDGYFEKVLILKAKNYILDRGIYFNPKVDKEQITLKGSSLRDKKKEVALSELLDKLINDIMNENSVNIVSIYEQYIKEAYNIQDISRWSTKKTVSKSVLNPTRTNEEKILKALNGLDIQEGDKYQLYTAIDGERQVVKKGELQFDKKGNPKMEPNTILKLSDRWINDEDNIHYVKRVYMTMDILKNVIDMDKIIKYHLKGNIPLLDKL